MTFARRIGIKPIATPALIFLVFAVVDVHAQQVSTAIIVIDGQTLTVGSHTYRLQGIVAPRLGERCVVRSQEQDCGVIARAQLLDLTAGTQVECDPVDGKNDEPRPARCLSNGYDLSEGMVYTGWARAVGVTYRTLEIDARDARRGMWNLGPDMYPNMR